MEKLSQLFKLGVERGNLLGVRRTGPLEDVALFY